MHPSRDAMKCDYCRTICFPEKDDSGVRVLGETLAQTCPICSTALTGASLEAIAIGYCTCCRGMSVPMRVLSTLVDELRSDQTGDIISPPTDPAELRRVVPCPNCHQPMDAHFYAGPGHIVIDSCEACNLTWFDHGELARVAHAPAYA